MASHTLIGEIRGLVRKELQLEWRQKYALNGLIMYAISMVIVVSLAFLTLAPAGALFFKPLDLYTWNVIFWVMLLFVAVNVTAKSFMAESSGQLLYLYTLAHPRSIILAKLLYNAGLLILIAFITAVLFFYFAAPQAIEGQGFFLLVVVLGSAGFAANLTLVSAISSKAQNRSTLMAVLGFPLMIPQLLNAIQASSKAISGENLGAAGSEFLFFGAILVIIVSVSVVLFPFLWQD